MPKAEAYLSIGGVEVANALRTFTYLRRGLGGQGFAIGMARPLTPEVGYEDLYGDTYQAGPYWVGNLACYCKALDGGPYVSPTDDPAPWYNAARPASADFLGFVPEVVVPVPATRQVYGRNGGGGVVGAQDLGPRLLQVTAFMYAASQTGMEWGERWLTSQLVGELDDCADTEVSVLLACPPDAEEAAGYFRSLVQAGLIDGPVFSPEGDTPDCYVQAVSFQIMSSRPHLMAPAATCVADTYLRLDEEFGCVLEPDADLGPAAARITIRAGTIGREVTGLVLTGTVIDDGVCPSADDADITYELDSLDRGHELVIDASTRKVTLTDTVAGTSTDGLASLDFDGLFDWMEAAAGSQLCLRVDATDATYNYGTSVMVERIDLEL